MLSKKYKSIVPYFYKERSVIIEDINNRYFRDEIAGKQHNEECKELSRKTLAAIAEVEQQIMANKIAGVACSTMKSPLSGNVVYIADN